MDQETLKKHLDYCPDSGQFTWSKRRGPVPAGKPADSISNEGYIRIGLEGRRWQAHRLAFLYMTGRLPPEDVDHINGVRTDNRWCNIRMVNRTDNTRNSAKCRTNRSGVTGVSWARNAGKWASYIGSAYKKVHLGLFDDFFDAICARKSAENQHKYHPNHGRTA